MRNKWDLREILQKNAVTVMFVLLCLIGLVCSGQTVSYVMYELFGRLSRNSFIVLALIIPIIAGMGINFAITIGAMAAQIAALWVTEWQIPGLGGFAVAALMTIPIAALFGFLIGIPVLRLKGDYLAIVTLAFGEIIKNVVNVVFLGRDSAGFHVSTKDSMSLGLEPGGQVLIKGPQGITGTPNDSTFLIGIILILVTLFIVINLINSRTGRAIMAIRDNRIAAESVGIDITKYKLLAFSVSAALAGTAGVLYAHNLSTLIALPKNFGYNMSIMILVFVVLGGIGNIRGSIIAAVVLTLLPELLRSLNDYRMLIYAVVLIATMIFTSSQGGQEIQERIKAFFKRGKKAEEVK